MTQAGALYTRDILRWAACLPVDSSIENADGSAEKRSPSCGSVVRAEVLMNGDRIEDAVFRVHACALGQASSAILLKYASGLSISEVDDARNALENALKHGGPWPEHWEELALLEKARDYPGRHAALLIGYDALLAAARDGMAKKQENQSAGTDGRS